MSRRVRLRCAGLSAATVLALAHTFCSPSSTIDLEPFAMLHGSGRNIDSVAFWSGAGGDLHLFVTGKDNHRLEIWRYPFEGREQSSLLLEEGLAVNGVAVDEETDRLYVTSGIAGSARFEVNAFSLPGLEPIHRFGLGILGEGETNLAILHRSDGERLVFVTDDQRVHIFRDEERTATWVGSFAPRVSELETVMADDYAQLVYVPDEGGAAGLNPGVHVFDAEGSPHLRHGSSIFGSNRIFEADAEGIALYRCFDDSGRDSGRGLIVVADQRAERTDLEFFDRVTWRHAGTLNAAGLANTDGIAVFEGQLPGHRRGILAAVHNDTSTALIDFADVFAGLGVDCPDLGIPAASVSSAPIPSPSPGASDH